ncbi:MAG: protein kinase, partial [Ktedonobacterales bacterium]
MSLAPGTTLARRYRVIRPLGEGGMGSVYLVDDLKRPGAVWALKELLDDASMSAEDREWVERRFNDEITLLKDLNHIKHPAHPAIPAYVDDFRDGARRYFVMEFVPGESLEQRLERAHAPLAERDVLGWMIGVCDTLAFLHGKRPPIIVRDLKPANIMITPTNEVRLIDFGIARTYKAGKVTNTENLGTMTYASPEHHGQGQTDARSDIYSLGATMYHVLTNHEPTPMETPAPGSLRHYQPKLSLAAERIVIQAMQLTPATRYQSAQEMRAALERALAALERALAALPAPSRVPVKSPATSPSAATSTTSSAPATSVRSASRAKPVKPSKPAARAPVVTRPAATLPTPVAIGVGSSQGSVCPRCGFVNRRNARFCAHDGAPLRPGVVAPKPKVEAAPITHVIPSLTASTAELHAHRASEAFSGARYMQAIRQSEEAIGQGHATYEVYLTLGRAYRQVGRAREAANAFERAAKLRPTGEALLLAGQAWQAADDTMHAQIAYTRARTLDRHN